jgi:3-methyladenine DNA glycosylase AlkD
VNGTIEALRGDLSAVATEERREKSYSFFQANPGGYGEGDQFLGVAVPDTRRVARRFRSLSLEDIAFALCDLFHEVRLAALILLVHRFERADASDRRAIVDLYLERRSCINNWDLVDSSAPQILGGWLLDGGSTEILDQLVTSESVWDVRIAVLATFPYIRAGRHALAFDLIERILDHPHDLIHKACGWMLREIGKRDIELLREFLAGHADEMPRTMLRYAIEKLPREERTRWLDAKR